MSYLKVTFFISRVSIIIFKLIKMRLFIVLALVSGLVLKTSAQDDQSEIMNVRFDGGTEQGYYFTDLDTDEVIKFAAVDPSVMQEFDLTSKEWIGQEFELTYSVDYQEMPEMQNMADTEEVAYEKKVMTVTGLTVIDSEESDE